MNNPFSDIDFNMSFHNFNPDEIQTDETINCVFIVDVSPSVSSYIKDLNLAFADFIASLQNSHLAHSLLVSVLEFNENVKPRTGFQPIQHIKNMQFTPSGGGTALYDASLAGLKNALSYRNTLLTSGVQTKTLIFIITDGEDNSSSCTAAEVKKQLDAVMANEQNAYSVSTVLFGVGSAANFRRAQQEMGINHLATVGTSGADIKKMIGFISRSISSTAGNQALVF
ncbi:MAG: VWA domain-containing protein [Sphingobacteriales bacterium]|jgi:uncharacterized protein YegL|nr:VWA domain-containing protein [Sphingobacteriales bacterium]MBP9141348.1 VWA domain-containing protein [Chitinophagales bacterium]MDA0198036.1 VWA domain-containing protein [Bacteroidota bacterium]MBK6890735.1 VWA domain-containing protein [Sphingobacteriales bacterium]MBK7526213.1 VWA domain-containing protein [Sphingobacteriales bacterium]